MSYDLFVFTETDTGSDPYPEGFPRIGQWLLLYYEEIFTLHTNWDGPRSLSGYCSHFWTGSRRLIRIRVRLRLYECVVTRKTVKHSCFVILLHILDGHFDLSLCDPELPDPRSVPQHDALHRVLQLPKVRQGQGRNEVQEDVVTVRLL